MKDKFRYFTLVEGGTALVNISAINYVDTEPYTFLDGNKIIEATCLNLRDGNCLFVQESIEQLEPIFIGSFMV